MPQLNIADLFESAVDRHPQSEAIVSGQERWSFARLDARANQIAHLLASRGVGVDDRVGVCLRNGPEHMSILLGAFKLRAVPFNINYRYTSTEVAYLLDDADPKLVFHGPDLTETFRQAASESGREIDFVVGRGEDLDAVVAPFQTDRPTVSGRRNDDGYLLYTGGTTGMPKGVQWRQADILIAALGVSPESANRDQIEFEPLPGLGETRRVVVASPFVHGTAQWVALGTLLGGGTVISLATSTFNATEMLDLIEAEKATVAVVVGDAFGRPLADALTASPSRWDLGSLVALVSGGAVLSPAVHDQLNHHLPWVALVDGYGTSETGGQGNSVTWPGQSTPSTTRFPLGGHTALLDDDGTPLVPAIDAGRVGLIARRGYLPIGYRNDPSRTEQTFQMIGGERWAIPGDYGRLEADGSVTLLGRGASSINTGGEKVFPDEVEAALKSHPAVFDAAVLGEADERWGERVVAIVEVRPGQSAEAERLAQHCRQELADYKVPRRFLFVDSVRRQPSGKLDRRWALETVRNMHSTTAD